MTYHRFQSFRRGIGGALVTSAVVLGSAGCMVLPASTGRRAALASPEREAQFTVPGPATVTSDEPVGTHRRYDERRLQLDASSAERPEHTIDVDYFLAHGDAPRPLVLCLPTLGGDHAIARHFARVFVREGFHAAVVRRQESYKDAEDLAEMDEVFRRIVVDHRQALDVLVARPEVDGERIGVLGLSAGAIKATFLAAAEPRVDAVVLALVGGDLPHIFTASTEDGIVKRRNGVMAEHDLTLAELRAELENGLTHDPLDAARFIETDRVLLVLGRFDTVIPFSTGMRLREALGEPATAILPTAHYSAIAFLPVAERLSVDFMVARLGRPPS